MGTLIWIESSAFVGGALSVLAADLFAFNSRVDQVPMLIGFAIGAILHTRHDIEGFGD